MLKPPNECVVAAVRAGIFEIFNPNLHKALDFLALRHALDDDDLAKLVTDTAMIVETYKVYFHGGNMSRVLEQDVQGWYTISWGSLKYEYIGLRNSCWAEISVFSMVIHDCIYIYICMYIYLYVYEYMYTCMYTYISMYICTDISIYI